jgi:hypothetical protein
MALDENKTTLKEAKAWLRERLDDGAKCPCCTQYAKTYTRKLNSGMAASLLAIYQRTKQLDPKDGWLHIPKDFEGASKKLVTVLGNREYPRLRYWGLLEQFDGPNDDSDTRFSGKWRLTKLGEEFVLGEVEVPEAVVLYDNRLMRKAPGKTDIRKALGAKFNYDELMAG